MCYEVSQVSYLFLYNNKTTIDGEYPWLMFVNLFFFIGAHFVQQEPWELEEIYVQERYWSN